MENQRGRERYNIYSNTNPFIFMSAQQNISLPIFVKIRLLDTVSKTIEFCKQLVDAGAALIAIHARYRVDLTLRTGPGNVIIHSVNEILVIFCIYIEIFKMVTSTATSLRYSSEFILIYSPIPICIDSGACKFQSKEHEMVQLIWIKSKRSNEQCLKCQLSRMEM